MQVRKSSRSARLFSHLALFAIAIAAVGGAGFGWVRYHHRRLPSDQYATTGVRRANLYPSLMASGRVESSKRTVIECLLENVAVGVRGQRLYAGGASTLISVVPDGTMVKRGEVLAVSGFLRLRGTPSRPEDLRRAGTGRQARGSSSITRSLELAVLEFRDGTMQETNEDFQRRLTLARSDLERAKDRLRWTHGMKAKGYVSASTVATDEYAALHRRRRR